MVFRLTSLFSVIVGPLQAVGLSHSGWLWPLLSGWVHSLKFLPGRPGQLALQKQELFEELCYGNKVTELDSHLKIILKNK